MDGNCLVFADSCWAILVRDGAGFKNKLKGVMVYF
jgi:hypothetical protein